MRRWFSVRVIALVLLFVVEVFNIFTPSTMVAKPLEKSVPNDLLTIKSICLNCRLRKHISYILYFSIWLFSRDSNIKAINFQQFQNDSSGWK